MASGARKTRYQRHQMRRYEPRVLITHFGEGENRESVRRANRPNLWNVRLENPLLELAALLGALVLVGAGQEVSDIGGHRCIEGVFLFLGG